MNEEISNMVYSMLLRKRISASEKSIQSMINAILNSDDTAEALTQLEKDLESTIKLKLKRELDEKLQLFGV